MKIVNFKGDFESIFELAHELAHNVHFQMSSINPYLLAEPNNKISEISALFGEQLISKKLEEYSDSHSFKKALKIHILDNIVAKVHESAYDAIFEIEAHKMATSSQGTSINKLSDRHYSLMKEMVGKEVNADKELRKKWMEDSNLILDPFYASAYPFAQLSSLVLFDKYLKNKEEVVENLEDMMAADNSHSVEDLMYLAGLNLNKGLWEKGFRIINSKVKELRRFTY